MTFLYASGRERKLRQPPHDRETWEAKRLASEVRAPELPRLRIREPSEHTKLAEEVVDALDTAPPRLDSRLVFYPPSAAVESTGLAVCKCGHLSGAHDPSCQTRGCRCEAVERSVLSPVPYVLRHTFASNALAAGVGTFEVARAMGTSLEMIERTYRHLVRGADDAFRSRLDAFAEVKVATSHPASV